MESQIKRSQDERAKNLIDAQRNDAVVKFCQHLLDNGIFMETVETVEGHANG